MLETNIKVILDRNLDEIMMTVNGQKHHGSDDSVPYDPLRIDFTPSIQPHPLSVCSEHGRA